MATSLGRHAQVNMSGLALKVKDVDVSGNVDVTGNVVVTGTLAATGDVTLTGDIAVDDIDSGASGNAGSIDIFPATAAKGKIQILAVDNTGDTTLTVTNAAQAGAVTYTIPDAGASANFVMSQGAATIVGAKTFSTAMIPTGGVAAAGGFTASPRHIWAGQEAPSVSTDYNNSTPVITETYVSEIFVPCNMTVTGVVVFNGSDVTGNMTVALANSAGTTLAAAISASTAGSGVDSMQRIPFAVAYAAVGPASYFIQVQYSSATARYNTHILGNHGVLVQTSQTYGVMTNFTAPTTFVTAVGNVCGLY